MLRSDSYTPPGFLFNGHIETIYPAMFRKVNFGNAETEEIETPDGDFLEADFYRQDSSRILIISHGLEGNARRPYTLGMARKFFEGGFDVCSWNFRSCGSRMNRNLIFYHSGATYDLDCMVNHVIQKGYQEVYLLGFSLGGNMTLKYLGEGRKLPEQVKAGVAISVPMDLSTGSKKISQTSNRLYEWRFLRSLKKKVRQKAEFLPLDVQPLHEIKRLKDFDEIYTSTLHGFHGAEDYYRKNSSMFFLPHIEKPVLILQARNDSFLTEACFPEYYELKENITWDVKERGGHVGFTGSPEYYSEMAAWKYVEGLLRIGR